MSEFFLSELHRLVTTADIPRPEQPSQANLSPDDAHGLWTAHIEPLTQLGYELIGPSVTTGSDGFNWLTKFMGLCKTCSVRFMSIVFV
jgi:hypothetical protein